TARNDLSERNLTCAGGFDALARHETLHAEDVENRFVDTVGRKRAESFKIVLAFELERPRQHGNEIYASLILQIHECLERSGSVGGIERAVAIGVRGVHL